MAILTTAEIENRLLEKFFLDPIAEAPIRALAISDVDLSEVFADQAGRDFAEILISSLPNETTMRDIVSGLVQPRYRSNKPDFIRILVFLSWMQTTERRDPGERDFGAMLERHLGYRIPIRKGLPGLWASLKNWLYRSHDIELLVPEPGPHTSIGSTLRMTFPTWRDLGILRRAVENLPDKLRDAPDMIEREMRKVIRYASKSSSIEMHFDEWAFRRNLSSGEHESSPFMVAWRSVLKEFGDYGELFISDHGPEGHLMEIRLAGGDFEPIDSISASNRRLSPHLREQIRRKCIHLNAEGLGSFRTISGLQSRFLLLHSSVSYDRGQDSRCLSDPIARFWQIWELQASEPKGVSGGANSDLTWESRIRAKGGHLFKFPITPCAKYSGVHVPVFKVDEHSILPIVRGERAYLPDLPNARHLVVELGSKRIATKLSSTVREHIESEIKKSDPIFTRDADGPFECSAPLDDNPIWLHEPKNTAPDNTVLEAIGEALYAKSKGGLGMSSAYSIVSTALDLCGATVRPWEVIKCFKDGDWFTGRMHTRTPSETLFLEALRFREITLSGKSALILLGPTPQEIRSRLRRTAGLSGCRIVVHGGVSKWALSTLTVHGDQDGLQDFQLNMNIQKSVEFRKSPKLEDWSEPLVAMDIDVQTAKSLTGDNKFDTLQRIDRIDSPEPRVYRSKVLGRADAFFGQSDTAMFAHAVRCGQVRPVQVGHFMTLSSPRTFLPSSWTRQLRVSSLCSAGASDDGLEYLYPWNDQFASKLVELFELPAATKVIPSWYRMAAKSKRFRCRSIVVGDTILSGNAYRRDQFGSK